MSEPLRIIRVWFVLAGLAGGAIAAEADSPGTSEAIEVALVNVEISVIDSQGYPVTDLRAADFRLRVDGRDLPFSNFARLDERRRSPAGGLTGADIPPTRFRLALYIDTAFLRSGELAAVEPSLIRYLGEDLPASVPVMLVVADPELQVVEGFTSDRQAVLAGIHTLAAAIGKSRIEAEYSQIQREFEEVLGRASSGAMPYVQGSQAEAVLTQIGAFAAKLQDEVVQAANRLDFLVQVLQGLPGTPEILFLTGRPPAHAGPGLLAAWRQEMGQNPVFSQGGDAGLAAAQGGQDSDATGLPDGSAFGSRGTSLADLDAAEVLRRTATQAAAAGVTIHAIDLTSAQPAKSLVSTSTAGQGVAGNPGGGFTRRSSSDQGIKDLGLLREVVGLTGGEILRGADLAHDLSRLTGLRRIQYSLAFTPPVGLDGAPHEINLSLTDANLDYLLNHRRFFRTRSHDQKTAQSTVSSLLAGEQHNPLDATVEVRAHRGDESSSATVEVKLALPFSRIALRADGSHHVGQLSVFSLSGEPYLRASSVRKGVVPIRVANDQMLTALGRLVEYSWEMEMAAESRHVAIGIRDDLGTLLSIVVAGVEESP